MEKVLTVFRDNKCKINISTQLQKCATQYTQEIEVILTTLWLNIHGMTLHSLNTAIDIHCLLTQYTRENEVINHCVTYTNKVYIVHKVLNENKEEHDSLSGQWTGGSRLTSLLTLRLATWNIYNHEYLQKKIILWRQF